MKERDYICLFRSKFEVLLKLSDLGIREMLTAMYAFLEGNEIKFTDAQAQALWWTWELEFKAAEKKYAEICARRAVAGRLGGNQKQANLANASKPSKCYQKQANASKSKQTLANPSKSSYTDTDTDTDKKENIYIKEKSKCYTIEEVLLTAQMPDVALSADEARKFFDFYASQNWLKSNGQPLTELAPALRIWKRNRGNFDTPRGIHENDHNGDLGTLKKTYAKKINYFDVMHNITADELRVMKAVSIDEFKTALKAVHENFEDIVERSKSIKK